MFSDKRCEIKCVFPFVVGIRIMSIHTSCDMYLRLGRHLQIRLYYVLPYKAKISAQHGIGFDRCIVYLGLTMPNLQKKRLLISKYSTLKSAHFWGEPSILGIVSLMINFTSNSVFYPIKLQNMTYSLKQHCRLCFEKSFAMLFFM